MGDRVVYSIRQDEELSLNLYSHWGGEARFINLAVALQAAKPRIEMGDMAYTARIIISQLVGDQWDSETGFGLWASKEDGAYGGDWPDIVIDLVNLSVTDETGTHSFDRFIEYHSMKEEYLNA